MKISEAVTGVVSELNIAGINATAEPAELSLPGALVMPGNIDFTLLSADSYEMDFEVYLVTRSQRTQKEVLDDLQELLDTFREVYPVKTAQPIALPYSNGSPIPGLLIQFTATITKD